MHCPRCLTWLEFDPLCLGSCLSCHKMREANPGPCIDESNSEPETVTLGFIPSSKVAKDAQENNWLNGRSSRWQDLFSWISNSR